MIEHLLVCNIEVFPFYIRSAHNHSADGLTRWAEEEVAEWLHEARMECEALPIEWLRTVLETNGPPPGIGSFALLGVMFDFIEPAIMSYVNGGRGVIPHRVFSQIGEYPPLVMVSLDRIYRRDYIHKSLCIREEIFFCS